MKSHWNKLLPAALGVMCACGAAHAHMRDYLVLSPYWTSPKGKFEIEVYNDFGTKSSGKDFYKHQTEIEYGLTDRLALGIYGVYEKTGSGPLHYARTKFESRYRLADYGRLPVNPALYLEYARGANGHADKVEGKLILSRDFGKNYDKNVTFNAIFEKERGPGSEWERSLAAGFSKALNISSSAGIEFKAGEGKAYIFPGAYITLGSGRRLNICAGFGLTDKSDDFQVRSLLEFELF